MALTPSQLRRLRNLPNDGTSRIRAARQLAKLTQVELAAEVGMGQSFLSDLERGRWATAKVDTARRFAEFFGCTIDDLFPSVHAHAS